jgi:hypothetical protein
LRGLWFDPPAGRDRAEGEEVNPLESKAPITQADLIGILNRQTEAGSALVVAGLVEDWLEKLLLAAGRELSKDSVKRIFGGPLKYFKPKIEIAYMFNLIDQPVRDDLRLIADIRNAFAHTTRFVYFGSDHIAKHCRDLSGWREATDKSRMLSQHGARLHQPDQKENGCPDICKCSPRGADRGLGWG